MNTKSEENIDKTGVKSLWEDIRDYEQSANERKKNAARQAQKKANQHNKKMVIYMIMVVAIIISSIVGVRALLSNSRKRADEFKMLMSEQQYTASNVEERGNIFNTNNLYSYHTLILHKDGTTDYYFTTQGSHSPKDLEGEIGELKGTFTYSIKRPLLGKAKLVVYDGQMRKAVFYIITENLKPIGLEYKSSVYS